jgi:hypothetical protein
VSNTAAKQLSRAAPVNLNDQPDVSILTESHQITNLSLSLHRTYSIDENSAGVKQQNFIVK